MTRLFIEAVSLFFPEWQELDKGNKQETATRREMIEWDDIIQSTRQFFKNYCKTKK